MAIKFDWKNVLMVGAGVGAVSFGLSYLYKFVFGDGGLATVTFSAADINVREQITSGVSSSAAPKILGLLGGVIPETGLLSAFLYIVVSAIIILGVGVLLKNWLPEPNGKEGKLVAALLYGSVASGIVLAYMGGSGLALPIWTTVIAMAIYFFIVALAYNGIRMLVKQLPELN